VARWYPSHDDPGSGSFVADEVVALRAAGIEVVVASWENADLRPREDGTEAIGRQAVASWRRGVADPGALSTPRAWGAGVPVARIPVVHPGGQLPARIAIDAHAALLLPFATALAARWPFDLVRAHVAIPDGAAAAEVATALGVPLVVTEHASSAAEQLGDEEARRAYRALLGNGRRLVAVSRALASRVEAPLGLDQGTLHVVPNVIPFDRFPLGTGSERDLDELLWVGARREHKGIDVLIRAVALARERRPGLHLRLVGRAPDPATEQRWLDLAGEVGLARAVTFEPPTDRDGVAAAMRRAGIFVHPSPFETFGMVAAEALASGLPVAARRSGGVEEVLAGQDAGAELADGDDAPALAAAILRLRSRLAEVDPAAIRAAVTGRFPAAEAIGAILGQARDAAAELVLDGSRAGSSHADAASSTPGMPLAAGFALAAGQPLPAILAVGLRRAIAARRVAALPAALAARLTVVTAVEPVERAGALSPSARWIEIDTDAGYTRRLAELGGPPDPRRGAVRRLMAACAHPRRAILRRQLLDARPGLRAAAERALVRAAWQEVSTGAEGNRVVVVALGADDAVVLADVLGAGGALAPGGLRWLADAWDAAGRP
jgi:D-inositol-3-phosphate glycosyltransferase